MFKRLIILSLFISFSCSYKNTIKEKETSFFVGTYTINKKSEGIYSYKITASGQLKKIGLAAKTDNPSFLAKSASKNTLFAVDESNNKSKGLLKSYKIEKDSLIFINKAITGGKHPCFVTVNKNNYVLTANYSGGNIGLHKANNSGKLSPLLHIQQHVGKGTTKRQEAPHAHSAWFHPTKNEVISVDLGTNDLWFSKIDTLTNSLTFTAQEKLKMAEGAGPRHLVFHPNNNYIYVLNELNNTISLVTNTANTYRVITSISTLPETFKGFSKAADIHVSKDGLFVYASNRGYNSIAIFKVNQTNGHLTLVGFKDTQGKSPRNFAISPDGNYLLVANQETNTIVSFKINITTGKLTFIDTIPAPSPVCILF